MDLFGGIVVFVVVWWLVLFMVLPFGAAPPEEVEPGMATSAPERPRLLAKMLVATVIALALTFAIRWVMESGLISLREPPRAAERAAGASLSRPAVAESYCLNARGHPVHGPFHDEHHGFPVRTDAALLDRLALEINQAGLSWLVALRRREGLARAFAGYDLDAVAAYGEADVLRLFADPGVVRHRRKIEAVIENARRMAALRERHGSALAWLDVHHPLPLDDWVRLFRRTFVFVGPEIVNELLTGIGYLPGAHVPECPVFSKVIEMNPPWLHTAARGPGWP